MLPKHPTVPTPLLSANVLYKVFKEMQLHLKSIKVLGPYSSHSCSRTL